LTFTKLHKHSTRFQMINTRLVTTGLCRNRCVRFTIELIFKCTIIDSYQSLITGGVSDLCTIFTHEYYDLIDIQFINQNTPHLCVCCVILLNRYWGIVTVSGSPRASNGVRNRRHPSSLYHPLNYLGCPEPRPSP